MEKINYENLSLFITRDQLHEIVEKVIASKYQIFWGFNKGKMILNIYNYKVNNNVTFIRHKSSLEIIRATIISESVLTRLNEVINFSGRIPQKSYTNNKKKKEIYKEIDYYLMKLHEMRSKGNVEKTVYIKEKLKKLQNEWENVK